MSLNPYSLPITSQSQIIARKWLIVGVVALAIAGLFSLVPMLLRMPSVPIMLPKDFFATALVIHVDLSVLVWLLAISSLLWSLYFPSNWQKIIVGLATLGIAGMTLAGFIGEANPLKNNYVPVLQNPVFMVGLSFFFCSMLFQIAFVLYGVMHKKEPRKPVVIGLVGAAFLTLMAIIAFLWSYDQLPATLILEDPEYFYELLFWGGGHILQFVFVQTLLVAWLWIAESLEFDIPLKPKWASFLLGLNVWLGSAILCVYPLYSVMDAEHVSLFTTHMQYVGGLVAAIFLLYLFAMLLTQPKKIRLPAHGAFLWSLLLFAYGGILGICITGNNVSIPAHYHGSIVGVSIAFMGLCYLLLPKLGYQEAKGRLAYWQPHLLGFGQLLHITGLVVMGGYGALRKTPGVVQTVETQLGLGLFVSGGLLAVIGGLVFVVLMLIAIAKK